jgi:hypothetical protein
MQHCIAIILGVTGKSIGNIAFNLTDRLSLSMPAITSWSSKPAACKKAVNDVFR